MAIKIVIRVDVNNLKTYRSEDKALGSTSPPICYFIF